jgi:hypothetical protein
VPYGGGRFATGGIGHFDNWGLIAMAKNTGSDFRRGSVTGRTQFQRPDGNWQKRNERNGQPMSVKNGGEPFKGVAREPDGRDTTNA